MGRHVQVSVENGIVRAVMTGDIEGRRSTTAMTLAADAAAGAKSNLLLIDITGAHYRNYHALAVEQAHQAARTGIMKCSIAILGKEGDPKLSYFETVAINRGIRARAFTRESDAIAWLKSRSDKRQETKNGAV